MVLARKLTVECPRIGHLLRALSAGSLCRLSKERAEDGQAWRFRRSAWWAGLCAIGRIERQPGWWDHQACTMNGGSEHLNDRSQWRRVEVQPIVANMRCGNSIVTLLCLISFFRVRLERQWRRDCRGRSFHSEASLEQETVPGTVSSTGLISLATSNGATLLDSSGD